MNKKELRLIIKNRLSTISEENKKNKSHSVAQEILQRKEYKEADVVLSYMAADNELDTTDIMKDAMNQNKKTAVPKTVPHTSCMDFYFFDSEKNIESQVKNGSWNIKEPDEDCVLFDIQNKEISADNKIKSILVIVPGVAFGEDGTRLGHGKGFYDIYLGRLNEFAKLNNIKLNFFGVCFAEQICPDVPSNDFDVRMNKVFFA